MTTQPSQPAAQEDIVVQKLREKRIEAIALVDDAYDPLDAEEVSKEQVRAFLATVNNRRRPEAERMRQELDVFVGQHVEGGIKSSEDIDADVLNKLWEERATFEALREPLVQLFSAKIKKSEQLDRICSRLRERCTSGEETVIKIKTLGGNGDVASKVEDAAIVFIDYHMGADDDPEALKKSIQRAKDIATEIYSRYADSKLPLIILMSSSPTVTIKEHQDRFRRDSGWLNGLFYCVSKEDLEDQEKIGINLATWIERLEEGSKIQQFIKTVSDSLRKTSKVFTDSVKDLSLEDYAYVQSFSLDADGQPLGEYMLWLFGSYLNRLVFEDDREVNEQQGVIDKLTFASLPLNQLMPSPELIEMYDSALFNKHIGDITRHPIDNAPDANSEETDADTPISLPYLRLGHLFVKEDATEVRMVINADCDLAYKPGGRSAISVVALIVGELHEIKSYAAPLKEPKTEFFKYLGKAYHISWQVNKIEFYKYDEVLKDLKSHGFSPYATIRVPFALEVQRAYAAHFSRIGMPVAPPIFHEVKVAILHRTLDGKVIQLLEPSPDLAFLMTVKDKKGSEGEKELRCRFTTHFGHQLKRAVIELRNTFQKELDDIEGTDNDSNRKRDKLNSKIGRFSELLEGFDRWFLLNHSPNLSGQTKPVLLYKQLIGVQRNLNEKEFADWGNYQLIVNLIDPEAETKEASDKAKEVRDE